MTRRLRAAVGLGALLLTYGPASAQTTTGALDIERIAALPSLIGTAPAQPRWSRDSQMLAFLWNDVGMPFKDIWVVAADGGGLRRMTDLKPAPAPGAATGGSLRDLQQDAAVRLHPGIAEMVWAPNGEAIVFTFEGNLYRVALSSGDVMQLTRSEAPRRSLAFSPDGTFLSFLQGGDLHLWNQQTDELVQATDIGVAPRGHIPGASFYAPDAAFMSYRWSPDGRYLALVFEDRRRVRTMLFPDYLGDETRVTELRRDLPGENELVRSMSLYSVAGGRAKPIELAGSTDRRLGSFSFSPNGAFLLIDQFSEDGEHRWIHRVDTTNGATEELRHDHKAKGGSTTSASSLWTSVWSTDGDRVLFVSDVADSDGWFRFYEMPASGGAAKPLTNGDWSVVGAGFEGASVHLSKATNELFFVATEASPYERQVYRMSETGGPVTRVTSLSGSHQPFVSPDGKRVAILRSSDVTPKELYLVAADGGSERAVTHSPPEEFTDYPWVEPSYVTFESRADGATLHGRLLVPPNLDRSKRYPAVLGPVYSNTVRNRWVSSFDTFQQYMALELGYLVLLVDIRGSVGYGREFRSQFIEGVGEIDIEDLHSGVDYLETLPYVDPDRVGIWGWSYGGLLTAMSLFKKPGVYQAGVAGAPATNVHHATTGEVDLFYHPSARPELYRQGSAVNFAEGLRDPLMIIHGMQDTIVLFKDSVTLAEKLMMLGKDFDLVPLPSSVHSARNKDYVATHVYRKIAQHFERHLGRGPR